MVRGQEYVLINGKLCSEAEAKISVFDGSILYGYGIFETLRTYSGVFFAWEKHYQRLVKGCKLLNMKVPFNQEQGLLQLQQLRDNYMENGYENDSVYRITVTPGKLENWRSDVNNTVIISRRPLVENLSELQGKGIHIAILDTKRLPSVTKERVKGIQFADIVLARNELHKIKSKYIDGNLYDGFMLNDMDLLVEATCSNVFIVVEQEKKLVLLTPSPAQEPLLGITRQYVINIAREIGLQVLETSIDLNVLRQAKEIFITNSVQEIVPVSKVILQSNVIFNNNNYQYKIAHKLLQAYNNHATIYK